jgi:hypothetical protein
MHRRLAQTIRDVKLIRLCVTSYLAGCPQPPNRFKKGKKEGLPIIVERYLLSYLSDIEGKKIVMTAMICIRTFEGIFPESTNDVEAPFTGDPEYIQRLGKYLPAFARRKKFERPRWKS